ncbi:DUF418 domain-containing protein [Flavobacterium beibuense]|uniref:DUF418 domain-containing protein n=1 Tax=Flavobacterium beibuense TaxID=657326 RepID=UPI003A8FA3F1
MEIAKNNKRIIGIDLARALAVFGMIIVNFKVVLGGEGSSLLKTFVIILEGKAAATFVVLAGVGIALSTKKSIEFNNLEKLTSIKKRILKRAILLFVLGMSYITIWPADILHFYAVYMLITLLLLRSNNQTILLTGTALILVYPLLMIIWDFETGWDFQTLTYQALWSFKGFIRNLFYNGFHPVIPWSAFMVFGYWLGKQDLQNPNYVKKLLAYAVLAFVLIQLISFFLVNQLSDGSQQMTKGLTEVLGTSPIPPLPIYMLSGIAIAFTTISACILVGTKYEKNKIIDALYKTGQLALTFYVAHVVIGMGVIDAINPDKFGQYSVEFSVGVAIVFSLLCILFAKIWLKYKKVGPLEFAFRKLTT